MALQERLGYCFSDIAFLEVALTHSSYANENKSSGIDSNERLEFLGDSVLGMIVSSLLFESKSQLPEGRMTKLRAELVCEKSLASLAREFGLGEHLKLGRGEDKGGGRRRDSILADAVEAVIAAMYLDGGFEPVRKLIIGHLVSDIRKMAQENTDYKTALQEKVQLTQGQSLSYNTVAESGPDHLKVFSVEVLLNGRRIGFGEGRSKKGAEQAAAMAALEIL